MLLKCLGMPTSTKILIYLAVWKRPEITEICFLGIKRLRRSFNCDALAVISEESMIPLCEKYNIRWVMYSNQWLGEKKNFGLQAAKQIDFDYLLEIGSDDLVLNELIEDYLNKYVGKYDFFGIRDCAWYNSETGDCRRIISNTTYGAGRFIHRSVLDKVDWKIWNDRINRGLDNNSIFNFARKRIFYNKAQPLAFPCVIDIKGKDNLTKFNWISGVEYDVKLLFDKLSDEEVERIKNVTEQNTHREA